MIDYLFPIFGLGVAVTGIVVKGLMLAKEMANAQMAPKNNRTANPIKLKFAAVPLPVLLLGCARRQSGKTNP